MFCCNSTALLKVCHANKKPAMEALTAETPSLNIKSLLTENFSTSMTYCICVFFFRTVDHVVGDHVVRVMG